MVHPNLNNVMAQVKGYYELNKLRNRKSSLTFRAVRAICRLLQKQVDIHECVWTCTGSGQPTGIL